MKYRSKNKCTGSLSLAGLFLAAMLCLLAARHASAESGEQTEPFQPAGSPISVESFRGMPVPAESLRSYIDGAEAYTLNYLKEPDWDRFGTQAAALRMENAAGQVFVQPVVFTLVRDKEPPVLYGVVSKRSAYLDESILYLDGVWAEDNADAAPVITVDTSKVNTRVSGTYKIVYTATDYSGNSVSKTAQISLMEPKYSEAYVHELAEQVLGKIIRPDMVKTEKLLAVFDWCRDRITYGRGVGNKDWRRAAVQGFKKHTGDCFVYYSCARVMLEEIGVDYVSIERLGGRTHHYWLLVNIGTGWYHFDANKHAKQMNKCFMWTDEQCQIKPDFWRYDPSRYPEVAKEPFDYEAQVEKERAERAAGQQ